jgi:hypothetical protein
MSLWFRVFGGNDFTPEPAALLAHLHAQGFTMPVHFRGDDAGWFAADIELEPGATPLHLERYLATEEGIRADLNTWAAWVETCDYSPNCASLMERIIQARQLFTLRRPMDAADEVRLERVCVELCRYLAGVTAGVYQIDGQGFFTPAGEMVLEEY